MMPLPGLPPAVVVTPVVVVTAGLAVVVEAAFSGIVTIKFYFLMTRIIFSILIVQDILKISYPTI